MSIIGPNDPCAVFWSIIINYNDCKLDSCNYDALSQNTHCLLTLLSEPSITNVRFDYDAGIVAFFYKTAAYDASIVSMTQLLRRNFLATDFYDRLRVPTSR